MSVFSYPLVDVTVYTRGLSDKLTEIQDRISELENGSNLEDKVTAAVDEKIGHLDLSELEDLDGTISTYLDNNGFINENGVQNLIDEADRGLDEDDVRRIADEAIGDIENTEVRDLERRLDLYAQKVDAAIRDAHTLRMKVESLENASQDAVTLLGLLRRAAEIILGRS